MQSICSDARLMIKEIIAENMPHRAVEAALHGHEFTGRIHVDIDKALAGNDAYHALRVIDGLIMTGPTGTNGRMSFEVKQVYLIIYKSEPQSVNNRFGV